MSEIERRIKVYVYENKIFYQRVQPVAVLLRLKNRKEYKMINTSSKNNSFICVDEVCDTQAMSCVECQAPAEQQVHPLKKYLRDLWINIQLFFETNKWDQNVTLKVGDSHYTMKMDQIEARWRNQ